MDEPGAAAGPAAPDRERIASGDEQQRPRGSAAAAIGTMLVVALVGAGGVVAWARLGATDTAAQDEATAGDEVVPTALADGSAPADVPAALSDEVEGPVLAVAELGELPAALDECSAGFRWSAEPELERALVTPERLLVTLVGESQEFAMMRGDGQDGEAAAGLATCDAEWADGGWRLNGSGLMPLDAGAGSDVSWGGGEGGVQTVTATVAPPDGTAWVVQDRGSYRLAYPAGGEGRVPLAWQFREGLFGGGGPPGSLVTFYDDDGGNLGEELLGGF